ncbi:hypothetical protein [Streptomyces sp. HUAS TT20]|uniref:hypothetical protein n=1 Tax=Streptomyces sp. HUAS TT20 TaxID=3447509 RepID=UPI0021D8E0AB|nr:hypothetical protein [Streptomyces sp. HUAS 15-9]UXY32090.1 hypothetical protein N8I87_39775 [Streptomyces sp. HUAS 15-9]
MSVTAVLPTTALILVVALPAAAGAGKLARLDGAGKPAALKQGAAASATVITFTAAVTARPRRGVLLNPICWR